MSKTRPISWNLCLLPCFPKRLNQAIHGSLILGIADQRLSALVNRCLVFSGLHVHFCQDRASGGECGLQSHSFFCRAHRELKFRGPGIHTFLRKDICLQIKQKRVVGISR